MDYRVLGPLEVTADGPVALGGPKPRTLVALLLAARGKAVSASMLAEQLWGERPPATAEATLQAYVSRLRAVLPPGALRSEAGAYSLSTEAGELDADRFEAAIAAARAARLVGELEEAVAQFDLAEALWRGPALPELADAPGFRPEAARLDELRLNAIEERFAVELARGRHCEAVPELQASARQYPLRERLHELLMLALYRSGRQADALRAFQAARAHLAEEVGLDPGPELARLEGAILSHDPSLDLAPEGANPGGLRPASLPSSLTSFLGRAVELADLASFVAANRLVSLVGAGGAGKSRLALEVGADWAKEHPDSWVALVELVALDHPEALLPALRAALGLPAEGPSDLGDMVAAIGQSEGLLIVDNAEHLLAATARLCTALLKACPQLRVLVTSRAPLGVAGEAVWRLGGLDPTEAVSLFCDRAGRAALPDKREVAAICARLDGLPLPIELAAARLRHMTFPDLVAGLEDRLRALDEPGRSDPIAHHRTVTASVEWSLGLLTEADLQLAQVASVFEGGFQASALEEVAPAVTPQDHDLRAGLARLVDNSLVELEGSGRYRMLETVRAVSSRLLEAAGHRGLLADAHLAWMERLALAIVDPETDETRWLQHVKAEVANARAALSWALGEGSNPDAALRIATRLANLWFLEGPLEEGRRWLEASLPRATAGTLDYVRGLNQLAVLAYGQGDWAAAEAAARESLEMARALDEPRWISIGLNLLGTIALETGRVDDGKRLNSEALTVARPLDPETLGTCLVNLACAHQSALEYTEAAELLREARELFADVESFEKHGAVLCNLAVAHRAARDYDAAEECLQAADEIYRRVADQRGIVLVLNSRAVNAIAQGRFSEAGDLLAEGLAIARDRGDRLLIVEQLMNRADAEMGIGDRNAAASSLNEALSIEVASGSRLRASAALRSLAILAASRGDWFEGRALAEQALSVARAVNNALDVAEALAALALVTDLAQAAS